VQRFRAWWDRRSRRGKIALVVLAVLVGLTILGALLPSDDDEASSGSPTTTVAEPQPEPEPEPEPPPPPPPPSERDTGRMSDGEYAAFSDQVDEVDREVAEYGEGLRKCGVLIQAFELAEASECIDEADNGVGDAMLAAYFGAEELEGDVGKACLKNLKAYKNRLDVFYGWYERMTKAGKDLQFEEFNQLAQLTGVMTRRYQRTKRAALASCAPV
jgi:hypothetical protein